MCLAIPAKIIKLIEDNKVVVDVQGVKLEVSSLLMPDLKVDDYVLVHAGFVIEKISKADAEEGMDMWDEIKENDKR
ncbi:MAG: HypC/HybG/HupF family hydrogenase formation chaperone [bacterium]